LIVAPFGIADRLQEAAAGLIQQNEAAVEAAPVVATGLRNNAGFQAAPVSPAADVALEESMGFADYFAIFGTDGLIFFGLCLVLFLWFFSLQCAGAVLVFMQRFQHVEVKMQERNAERTADLEEKTDDVPDVMELIRSRMQNRGE
jgi:hypothetical protein